MDNHTQVPPLGDDDMKKLQLKPLNVQPAFWPGWPDWSVALHAITILLCLIIAIMVKDVLVTVKESISKKVKVSVK